MRRLAKIVAAAVAVLLLVAGLTFWSLYRSATADVPEYEALLEVDHAEAVALLNGFESRLAALYSETQSLPEWSGRFTAQEINAWLAVRLEQDFRGYAEAGMKQPRVWVKEGSITLAARSRLGSLEGVLTVTANPFVTEEHELALEVTMAKFGRLDLPLESFGEHLRRTPLESSAPVRWTRGSEGLVILVEPGRIDVGDGRRLRFVGIDLREGELLLRGAVDVIAKEDVAH